jgi:hypothetical protein
MLVGGSLCVRRSRAYQEAHGRQEAAGEASSKGLRIPASRSTYRAASGLGLDEDRPYRSLRSPTFPCDVKPRFWVTAAVAFHRVISAAGGVSGAAGGNLYPPQAGHSSARTAGRTEAFLPECAKRLRCVKVASMARLCPRMTRASCARLDRAGQEKREFQPCQSAVRLGRRRSRTAKQPRQSLHFWDTLRESST